MIDTRDETGLPARYTEYSSATNSRRVTSEPHKEEIVQFLSTAAKSLCPLFQANVSPPATTRVNHQILSLLNILRLLCHWTRNHTKTPNDKIQLTLPSPHHVTTPIPTSSLMASRHLDRRLLSYANDPNRYLINHTLAIIDQVLKQQK